MSVWGRRGSLKGGGICMNNLKSGWNRKEERGKKNFKIGEREESWVKRWLDRDRGWNPLHELCHPSTTEMFAIEIAFRLKKMRILQNRN